MTSVYQKSLYIMRWLRETVRYAALHYVSGTSAGGTWKSQLSTGSWEQFTDDHSGWRHAVQWGVMKSGKKWNQQLELIRQRRKQRGRSQNFIQILASSATPSGQTAVQGLQCLNPSGRCSKSTESRPNKVLLLSSTISGCLPTKIPVYDDFLRVA